MADSAAAEHLARRLRELREQEWRDTGLTQAALARALGAEKHLGGATVSSWESGSAPRLPTEQRLRSYARFFATPRSLTPGPHLIPVPELTPQEDRRRLELERELLALHEAVRRPREEAAARRSWQFHDGAPVTIICPDAPPRIRSPLASPSNLNYTEMLTYADLDALVELCRWVSAENPSTEMFHCRSSQVTSRDVSGHHLVLLGGVGWNNMTRRLLRSLTQIPIRQFDGADPRAPEGDPFVVVEGGSEQRVYPELRELTEEERRSLADGDLGEDQVPRYELIEDVAWLARLPNPFDSSRTLTICNGVYSRGVLGAVRCLTDDRVRDANESYLTQRFPRGDTFALLLRVPVVQGHVIAPDLHSRHSRIYEWPPAQAAPQP